MVTGCLRVFICEVPLLGFCLFLRLRLSFTEVKVLVAQLCLTLCNPLAVARQAPLSMGFSRQEY